MNLRTRYNLLLSQVRNYTTETHSLPLTTVAHRVKGKSEIDMMEWTSWAALEYVCQAGLGYTFSTLDPTRTNEFTEAVKLLRYEKPYRMLTRLHIIPV